MYHRVLKRLHIHSKWHYRVHTYNTVNPSRSPLRCIYITASATRAHHVLEQI